MNIRKCFSTLLNIYLGQLFAGLQSCEMLVHQSHECSIARKLCWLMRRKAERRRLASCWWWQRDTRTHQRLLDQEENQAATWDPSWGKAGNRSWRAVFFWQDWRNLWLGRLFSSSKRTWWPRSNWLRLESIVAMRRNTGGCWVWCFRSSICQDCHTGTCHFQEDQVGGTARLQGVALPMLSTCSKQIP